ncbi:alpha/beta hydrolase [Sphingomonas sp. 1P06PA]|uniref:alpha/beta hydrolase family protein n=1 Tax=Sphingomonas sp. 1P06PA TaxID=554121 RepID=UPI0039A60C56
MKLFRMLAAAAAIMAVAGGASAQQKLSPADLRTLPSTPAKATITYGNDILNVGELRVPAGKGPFPVAMVIHGGCWTKGFETLAGTRPLASALTAKGIATWNIEYRQVGDAGGGWPGTFQDWAMAADKLRTIAKANRLDLKRVAFVGHSAGAHAALWLAARPKLKRGHPLKGKAPLVPVAAIAIDGPGDLLPFVGIDAQVCGKPVIVPLIGGTPAEQPQRYIDASPYALQPLGVRQYLVAGPVLTKRDADNYKAHGEGVGDKVEVLDLTGTGHFEPIAPGTAEYVRTEEMILRALGVPAGR